MSSGSVRDESMSVVESDAAESFSVGRVWRGCMYGEECFQRLVRKGSRCCCDA